MKLAWRVEHVLMRCQTMPWTIFRIGDGRIPARCSDNCDMSWQLATPCTARSWKLVSAHFANGAGWAGLCRAACCVTFCFRVGFFSFRFQIFQADTQRALHSSGAEAVAWRKMAGWWLRMGSARQCFGVKIWPLGSTQAVRAFLRRHDVSCLHWTKKKWNPWSNPMVWHHFASMNMVWHCHINWAITRAILTTEAVIHFRCFPHFDSASVGPMAGFVAEMCVGYLETRKWYNSLTNHDHFHTSIKSMVPNRK